MNHQVKIVNNSSIIVYFSLQEISKATGIAIDKLAQAIRGIRTTVPPSLAYVSVVSRDDAKSRSNKSDYFPNLSDAIFTLNTGQLQGDISGTIYSVKITLLNPQTPYDHLIQYADGLRDGAYNFYPRLTINGDYVYPALDSDIEKYFLPSGAVNIIGFDLIFNGYPTDELEVTPEKTDSIADRIAAHFDPLPTVDLSKYQTRQFSVTPLSPDEVPDPHFTPTAIGVNKIQENQSDRRKMVIDLDNVEDLEKLKGLFRGFNYPQMYDEKNINTLASIFSAHFKESEDSAFADLEKVVEFFLPINLPADIRSKVIELIAAKWAGFKHA
ncbi:hypothetical protein [Klebsiella pneumoniae]|uniref:hypothetical protein n=1 Tax=Klebsiella pneumoniae TaxID=573 RepID=UPI000D1BAEBB|nr:hypothetical protein [Klebsiella pneumoniae]